MSDPNNPEIPAAPPAQERWRQRERQAGPEPEFVTDARERGRQAADDLTNTVDAIPIVIKETGEQAIQAGANAAQEAVRAAILQMMRELWHRIRGDWTVERVVLVAIAITLFLLGILLILSQLLAPVAKVATKAAVHATAIGRAAKTLTGRR